MSFAAVIAGGVTLGTTVYTASQAKKQMDQAKLMETANPGFEGNPALQENATILQNRFSNYRLPNYASAMNDIEQAGEMGYRSVLQGSGSSSDILDGAIRIAYGTQQSQNNLNAQQAQGEDAALMQYLTANQIAGEEVAKANQWEREGYLRDRQDAANLTNASISNTNTAIRGAADAIGQFGGYYVGQKNRTNAAAINTNGVNPVGTTINNPYLPKNV